MADDAHEAHGSDAPRPVLLLIGCIALLFIGATFYLGYYAFTAPTGFEHPTAATAPGQMATPQTQPAPAQPPHT